MKTNKLAFALAAIVLAGASTTALADDKWKGDVGSNWLEHVQPARNQGQKEAQATERDQNSARSSNPHAQHGAVNSAPTSHPAPTPKSGEPRNTPWDDIYFNGAFSIRAHGLRGVGATASRA